VLAHGAKAPSRPPLYDQPAPVAFADCLPTEAEADEELLVRFRQLKIAAGRFHHCDPSEMSLGIVENFSTPGVVRSTFWSGGIGTAGPLRKICRSIHFSGGVLPASSSKARPVGWGVSTTYCFLSIRMRYAFPLPPGFAVSIADVAIEILAGYPPGPLDMAYFCPPLKRSDGKAIPQTQAVEQVAGRSWQRWSRHRTGDCPWVSGEDSLETHVEFVRGFLEREPKR
jgi:hypothetical protein